MCKFRSAIILKSKVVLTPNGDESHSRLLDSLNIEDNHMNASKVFVRAELIPPEGNVEAPILEWRYRVDQDITPDWYDNDPGRYEEEFRVAVKDWIEKNTVSICNRLWTEVKRDNHTYYFLFGLLSKTRFGKNNNYTQSDISGIISQSELLLDLRKEFGENLVPITTDLTSMDGFKDYGIVEGDILSIPTVRTYMDFGSEIPVIGQPFWLATPNQTPTRGDASCVRYVRSGGGVGCGGCCWYGCGVRPFFILQS